jgi:DnaJ-class molecular chaperone
MDTKTNLYDILNIEKNASESDIRKAYKKLAAIWHPDKCQDILKNDEYTTNFKKINQAYEILSNQNKRNIYDQTNSIDNIEDIYRQREMMNGYQFNHMPNMVRFIPDIIISIRLTLEEIYNGKTLKQNISRTIVMLSDKQDKHIETEEIDIVINPGIGSGQKIVLRAKGNKLFKDNKIIKVGNIVITVDEITHNTFKRSPLQPLHLYMNQKISVFQALLGDFDFTVGGLNKEKIILNMGTNIIKPGTVLCIHKKGMMQNNNNNIVYGNLYVIFDIEFPNELTEFQRSSLRTMTDYVTTKKKKNNDITWEFSNVDDLQTLLNTDDGDDNDMNEGQYMGVGPGQSVQCAQQ